MGLRRGLRCWAADVLRAGYLRGTRAVCRARLANNLPAVRAGHASVLRAKKTCLFLREARVRGTRSLLAASWHASASTHSRFGGHRAPEDGGDLLSALLDEQARVRLDHPAPHALRAPWVASVTLEALHVARVGVSCVCDASRRLPSLACTRWESILLSPSATTFSGVRRPHYMRPQPYAARRDSSPLACRCANAKACDTQGRLIRHGICALREALTPAHVRQVDLREQSVLFCKDSHTYHRSSAVAGSD